MKSAVSSKILNYDIAIVGLGPTGATLANILGGYGWSVIGIEKEETLNLDSRAVHFDDEIMRIFQSIGLADEIAQTSVPLKKMEFIHSPVSKPFTHLYIGSQDSRYGYNGAFWFYQPTLERHLYEGTKRFKNVTTLYGHEIIDLVQNEHGVTATVTESRSKSVSSQNENLASPNSSFNIQAKYLIGCDGGRSFVRKQINIPLESANFDEPWVVVDTRMKSGKKNPDLPEYHRQYCNPSQPVTYVPMPEPYYRWEFMDVNHKGEEQATDPEYVRQQLKAFVDLDKIEIIRIAYYTFHGLWAKKWFKDRIILAGDAAHQTPPFLGQGMCSGIRDASMLGWRLDLLLKDSANKALLNSYESERYAHVKHLIYGAIFLGSIIQTRQKWKAAIRNTVLFGLLRRSPRLNTLFMNHANRKTPLEKGFIGTNCKALAGNLAIQPRIDLSNGTTVLLDELLGPDFSIILRKGKNFQVFQLNIQQISAKHMDLNQSNFQFSNFSLKQWFDKSKVDFVLIRPDRYVFDAAKERDIDKVIADFSQQFPLNTHINLTNY
jgi:3-(3-hydroxy-phenyl)propionate hydroxylase